MPRAVKGKWFKGSTYETFDAAVAAANQWVTAEAVTVVQVETVVLPNIGAPGEEGSADGSISTVSGWASWHQFVRVWYKIT